MTETRSRKHQLDPKFRERSTISPSPFTKKRLRQASSVQTMWSELRGCDKNQAAELMKFKILTLLPKGKRPLTGDDEQFQFTETRLLSLLPGGMGIK